MAMAMAMPMPMPMAKAKVMPMAKKRALSLEPAAKRSISSAQTLCKQLEDLYSGLDSSFMWDTTRVWELLWPTRKHEASSGHTYEYVGRTNAQKVYESMLGMKAGQRMQVLGAAGSGKSTVVSTVAGYLIGCREARLVYLCTERFVEDPESCLLEALLVACGDAEDVAARLASRLPLSGLVDCCRGLPGGSLLFVVDEWDQLESERELEKMLLRASSNHMLVKVSSINSRERRIWDQSTKADQKIKTVHFDGPYNSDELKTWLGRSGLTKDELQRLERLTGGIPRLLRFYEETRGNEDAFLSKMEEPYTSKLFDRFIGKLETREELQGALHFVISGKYHPTLEGKLDLTCFYMDDAGLFHPLCPYLRSMAESYIMDRQEILECSLLYSDIKSWAAAVMMDLGTDGKTARNPARIGWNVESLVLGVMRYKKRVFGFEFKHYKIYDHGGELAALDKLEDEELEDGVLMGPRAFNETAVDAVYFRLDKTKTELKIKGLQITVADWKTKAKQNSHEVWKETVLPAWTLGMGSRWEVKQEYYYIMPKTIMAAEDSANPLFRRFGDVDASLSRLDVLLSLSNPAMPDKVDIKQCAGMKKCWAAVQEQRYSL